MAEADFRQKRHRFFHSLGAGPSVNVDRRFNHVADDGHVVPQVEALEHHRDAAADALDLPPFDAVPASADFEMLLADADLAAIRHFKKIEAPKKRALARAGSANDRDHVALLGRQRNAFQDLGRAEALGDVTRFNRDHDLPFCRFHHRERR